MYDNLKKTILYLLPAGSFSELMPIVLNVIIGVPQMLSNIQMILICVGVSGDTPSPGLHKKGLHDHDLVLCRRMSFPR